MSEPIFRDFDAAWAEAAAVAPSFKAFGETFTLPKSPPVKLTLLAMRAAQSGDLGADVDPKTILDIAGLLIGRDAVKTLLDRGIDFDQLGDLILFARAAYQADDGEGDDGPGDAADPPVQTPESPSSGTGPPSKPTSDVSTDWI